MVRPLFCDRIVVSNGDTLHGPEHRLSMPLPARHSLHPAPVQLRRHAPLATAHRDPTNNRFRNLAALCQRCHADISDAESVVHVSLS